MQPILDSFATSARSRRHFLHQAGAVSVLGSLAALTGGLPRLTAAETVSKAVVGSNVYGWGQYAQRDKKKLEAGDVDFGTVAQYAQAHRLPRRFTVELALEGGTQVTRSVVENHRLSREFVRQVFQA